MVTHSPIAFKIRNFPKRLSIGARCGLRLFDLAGFVHSLVEVLPVVLAEDVVPVEDVSRGRGDAIELARLTVPPLTGRYLDGFNDRCIDKHTQMLMDRRSMEPGRKLQLLHRRKALGVRDDVSNDVPPRLL